MRSEEVRHDAAGRSSNCRLLVHCNWGCRVQGDGIPNELELSVGPSVSLRLGFEKVPCEIGAIDFEAFVVWDELGRGCPCHIMKQGWQDEGFLVDIGECWILLAEDESEEGATSHVVGCHARCVFLNVAESSFGEGSGWQNNASNWSAWKGCLRSHWVCSNISTESGVIYPETLSNPHGELEVHRIELYTLLSSTKSEILRDSETVTIPFRLLPAEAGSLPW